MCKQNIDQLEIPVKPIVHPNRIDNDNGKKIDQRRYRRLTKRELHALWDRAFDEQEYLEAIKP